VYDPDPHAPGRLRVGRGVTAPWNDLRSLQGFFGGCDVVTYEFENVESATLRALAGAQPIVPSIDVLEISQDRVAEKAFMARSGLPHVAFRAVARAEELPSAVATFGLPAIIKTARGGYDGKGQVAVATPDEAERAAAEMAGWEGGFILEEPIALEGELSCIVARSPDGAEAVFPVFENLHHDHILDFTLLPSRMAPEVARLAEEIALAAARAFGLVGLLTVEFFLGRGGRPGGSGRAVDARITDGPRLYINEFAPRPHNSGHVTLKACTLSQYDALARVLVGAPLHRPEMIGPGVFCMGNLLGDVWIAQGHAGLESHLDLGAWRDFPDVLDVVLYGKREPRPRRKMGHFIVRGDGAADALARARAFRDALRRTRA
jgi:5-(carboxyamino)imidazole ribonucleotide synthase